MFGILFLILLPFGNGLPQLDMHVMKPIDIQDVPSAQQVLFTQVGSYASTVTYLHVAIPIYIGPILQKLEYTIDNITNTLITGNSGYTNEIANHEILTSARYQIAGTALKIYQLVDTLPTEHIIQERQLGAVLLGLVGGIGTYFGYLTNNRINQLISSTQNNEDNMNQLIDITTVQEKHLSKLDLNIQTIAGVLEDLINNNPVTVLSTMTEFIHKARDIYAIISNTIQQAQNQRLAVNLLTPATLRKLFRHLQHQAEKQNMKLLPSKQSDLFQLDASYLHNSNHTMTLILHVPMIQEENQLNLLQYIPFPLSQTLDMNTTITPKVDQDLLAIGNDYQFKLLGQTDLATCTKLGNTYLCEGRNYLRTDIRETCLGSLYLHHLPGVLKFCQFELGEPKEHVFPLGSHEYLVSSPNTYATNMICKRSHENIFINAITRIHLKNGCKIHLQSHILQPDVNFKTQFQITHQQWNWDVKYLFPTINKTEISQALEELRNQGTHTVDVRELRNLKRRTSINSSENTLIYILITMAIAIAIIYIFLIYQKFKNFNGTNRIIQFKQPNQTIMQPIENTNRQQLYPSTQT
jgi:hypothetical protein